MRLICFQPEIPQNLGTILRLSACWGFEVDIIGPINFFLSDKKFIRAGMDYLDKSSFIVYSDWGSYYKKNILSDGKFSRLIATSSDGDNYYNKFNFSSDDSIIFGRESAGLPKYVLDSANAVVKIPMKFGFRSINLAMSVGIVVSEIYRQCNLFDKL